MIYVVLLFYVDSKAKNTLILLENRNCIFPLHYGYLVFRSTIDIIIAIMLKGKYIEMNTWVRVFWEMVKNEIKVDTSMDIIFKVLRSVARQDKMDGKTRFFIASLYVAC